ncbi:MAG: hypothetical protein ACRDYD_00205 [Acidimicrobiales bacterium]
MLSPALTALRLSLHVLSAAIWVGGQLTLAGLVPSLRAAATGAPASAAAAFGRMAWPAFAVLVGTGIWNVIAVGPAGQGSAWRSVLWAKLAVVALSGISAFLHGRSSSRRGLAAWGAVSGLSATAALVLGVVLSG